MKKNLAFTLAEVLIVLGILGIIAELTIPTVIHDTKERANRTAWKKNYAIISQVYNQILAENGYQAIGYFTNDFKGSTKLANEFAQRMKLTKTCAGTSALGGAGLGATDEGCWHKTNEWGFLNNIGHVAYPYPGAISNDGTLMCFEITSTACATPYGTSTRCGTIFVDVNGFKKPNTVGKDIFSIILENKRAIPNGAEGANPPETTCIENSTAADNSGWGCSFKYIQE